MPTDKDESSVPYVATPSASAAPTVGVLPPIAAARPATHSAAFAHNASNIPVVNGVRQHSRNPQYPPTVVNLSAAPSSVAPHLLPEMRQMPPPPPFFEYMDKCRYAAGFMLCYYICTFFFLQPFFLGMLGVLTGFLGYYGSRPPIFAAHAKWVRAYLWMNMSMLVLNVWYCALLLLFLSSSSTTTSSRNKGGGDDGDVYYSTTYSYDEQHLGLFMGLVIGINFVLHLRGVRTARCFYAEMLRAAPLPGQRVVVVFGSAA